jgi:hypothetical protein
MQNRYVGDVGDFGKYGLLDFIVSETELKLGMNWYLTSPVAKEGQSSDGKFYDYLLPGTKYEAKSKVSKKYAQRMKDCDEKLYKKLQKIIIDWLDSDGNPDSRCVRQIEEGKILPDGTVFYSELLNKTDRKDWLNNSIKRLSECNLIFFDPDNGIDLNKDKSIKHVYFGEIDAYFNNGYGQSLVIYQHANRGKKFNDAIDEKSGELIKKLKVNYRRLKAGGIPLHRIPIEKTHKESSVHVFVPLVSICFVRILCRDPLLLLY